jgi:uncharacterized membrane protein YgcG
MWNSSAEHRCKTIGDRSGAFVWLYKESSSYMVTINSIFSLFTIISTALLGTGGIPMLFAYDNYVMKYGNLAIQVCMIMIGIVETVRKTLKFEEKISKFNYSCIKNQTLFNKIKNELNKPTEKRTKFEQFFEEIIKLDCEAHENDNDIPHLVIALYTKKMGKHALSYDMLFLGYMDEIIIVSRAPSSMRMIELSSLTKSKPACVEKPVTPAPILVSMSTLRGTTCESEYRSADACRTYESESESASRSSGTTSRSGSGSGSGSRSSGTGTDKYLSCDDTPEVQIHVPVVPIPDVPTTTVVPTTPIPVVSTTTIVSAPAPIVDEIVELIIPEDQMYLPYRRNTSERSTSFLNCGGGERRRSINDLYGLDDYFIDSRPSL